ncbi:fumarylacetoacetate hydrolase family protein [Amorphus sp. 3PC139-8]|uniref:fumarylacetoacetate hydrolase family protein n=1 Tax=Amorphus sp. 3PC139-8 TaxID=2735676 RepID=UPI00345CF195
MKLVTYRKTVECPARLGALAEGFVLDVERLGFGLGLSLPDRMLDFIDAGPATWRVLRQIIDAGFDDWAVDAVIPASNVTLLAPIPRPQKNIFGIGLNYVEHVAESSRALDTSADLPKEPVIFSKPPTSVIGPDEPIRHNAALTQQLDWEVELAAIIGTTARGVGKDTALDHVFGYSVMVDVSARDCRRAGQWIVSKGQNSFAPFGPMIVTADEIGDPQDLDLWLTINGEEKQRSNTRHMLFKVDHLVSDISSCMTLEPGDIIATGTPSGVGAGRDPQEWMWPGDVLECGVEKIGTLRHSVVKA